MAAAAAATATARLRNDMMLVVTKPRRRGKSNKHPPPAFHTPTLLPLFFCSTVYTLSNHNWAFLKKNNCSCQGRQTPAPSRLRAAQFALADWLCHAGGHFCCQTEWRGACINSHAYGLLCPHKAPLKRTATEHFITPRHLKNL